MQHNFHKQNHSLVYQKMEKEKHQEVSRTAMLLDLPMIGRKLITLWESRLLKDAKPE